MVRAAISRLVAILILAAPSTPSQSIDSPYAVERRLAAQGEAAGSSLDSAQSARGRATLLREAPARVSTTDLVSSFIADEDPALRHPLARLLAARTDIVWREREPKGALGVALLVARTERALADAVAKNVDRDGELKGFYVGQFSTVARQPERAAVLAAIARASWKPELHRVAAIHALGESTARGCPGLLEEIRTESLREFALPDPEKGTWRVPVPAVQRYVLLRRFHAVDHARSRHGDEEGIRWRIGHHGLEHRRLLASIVYVRGDRERSEFRSAAAWELFEVAYLHGRLGELVEARERYERLIRDFGGTSPIPTVHYNLACLAARSLDVDAALDHVRDALSHGYADLDWMMQDAELETVREDPRFAQLVSRFGGEGR